MPAHFADSPKTEAVYKILSLCQPSPAPETITKLYRPASKVDKTHINTRYEQILLNTFHYCKCKPLSCISFHPDGWIHHAVSCSREYRRMRSCGCALNTTPFMIWNPRCVCFYECLCLKTFFLVKIMQYRWINYNMHGVSPDFNNFLFLAV